MFIREDSRSAIDLTRLGWVAPLAVMSSIGAVLIVRGVAVALLRPDRSFTPLGWAFPVLDTAILTTAAALVFGAMASAAARPLRTFRRTAAVVLVLSLLPPIAAAFATSWGGNWANSLALIAMHGAAWAVCVKMLTTLTLRREEAAEIPSPG
jgi:hypothetical protein